MSGAARRDLRFQVAAALGSGVEVGAMGQALSDLRRLVDADCAAVCLCDPARPGADVWALDGLPDTWGARVEEMAPYDFVRAAVSTRPGAVLTTPDMLGGTQVRSTPVWSRCKEVGLPMEQVMAVFIDLGGAYGGVTLFRDKDRRFSPAARADMSTLVPFLQNALHNSLRFRGEVDRGRILEGILGRRGVGVVILDEKGEEVRRNEEASALIDRHLPGLGNDGLRRLLLAGSRTPALLRVRVEELRLGAGGGRWVLEMEEPAPIPQDWADRLSARELEAATHRAAGLERKEIAARMGIALETVKDHLRRADAKIGAEGLTPPGRR